MSEVIGIRLPTQDIEAFKKRCLTLKIDYLEYLKGAIHEITTQPLATEMLECMGFVQGDTWQYNPTAIPQGKNQTCPEAKQHRNNLRQ